MIRGRLPTVLERYRRWSWSFVLLLLFLLIAIVFTWPLLPNMTLSFPSLDVQSGGDPNIFLWQADLSRKALLGATPTPLASMLFYPVGLNPFAAYDGILWIPLSLPLLFLGASPILAYNFVLLLAIASAGFAMYTLVLYLTHSRYAAMVVALSFEISPVILLRATQHLNLVFLASLPFFLYAALRFVSTPNWRRGFILWCASFIAALSSGYFILSCFLVLLMMIIWLRKTLLQNKLLAVTVLSGTFIIGILPSIPMLFSINNSIVSFDPLYISRSRFEPLELFLPHPLTNTFGSLFQTIYQNFPSILINSPDYISHSVYAGPIVLGFILWMLFKKEVRNIPLLGLWFSVSIFLIILSLGPLWMVGRHTLKLPFEFLPNVLTENFMRSPHRFAIMVLVILSMMFGYALQVFYKRLKNLHTRIYFTTILIVIIIAERWIFPFPLYTPRVSKFYQELKNNQAVFAIVDLPILIPGLSEYNFFQTIHGKPIVDGEYLFPAYRRETFSFIQSVPILQGAVCADNHFDTAAVPIEESFRLLAAQRIQFIVVHNLHLHNFPECGRAAETIRRSLKNIRPVFYDGELTVYETPTLPPP